MTGSEAVVPAVSLDQVSDGRYRLEGELSFTTAREALALVNDVAVGDGGLHLDLSALDSVDSAGLAVLLECWRQCRLAGGRLMLDDPPVQLQRLIRISDLESVLEIA